MGRRIAKIAAYLVLALVVLVLLLYVGIINPVYAPLRDALVRTVTRSISQSLHGTVEIGALRGSLLSAPVLHHVELRDAQGTVIGHIDAIRLAYNLSALLRGRLEVQAVEIVRPQFTVVQQPDGQLNLQALLPASDQPVPEPPAGSGGLPVAVRLERLEIRDGQFTLNLPAMPGVQQVADLQVRLQATMDEAGLQVRIEQFTARTTPAAVDLTTLQGALQVRAGAIHIDNFRLQTGATLLTAHGTVPAGDAAAADLALQMQPLALAEIGRLLGNESLRDPVLLRLTAVGPPTAIQVDGQLSMPAARVDLQGQLNTAALPMQYNAQLAMAHLDLAALLGRADLQSDLNLALHVQGEGVIPHELNSALQLTIQPSHLGSLEIHPSTVHVAAVQQRFQVQRLDLKTSAAQLTASGALDLAGTSELHYALHADLADLRQLAGIPTLAGAVDLQGQARGTWPDLHVRGLLAARALAYQEHQIDTLQLTYAATRLGKQPQATAQLLVQQVRTGTLPIARVTLDATYQDGERQGRFALEVDQAAGTGGKTQGTVTLGETEQQVVIEEFFLNLPDHPWHMVAPLRLTVGPQRLHLDALQLAHADESLTLSGALAGEHLQDLQLRVSQLDLTYLQRLLHLPAAVGGRVNLQGQLAGTLAEPRLEAELSVHSSPQQHLPFEQVRTTLAYAQQRFQGLVQIQQGKREVLTVDLQLPIDLAFTSLPLAQRLPDAPVAVRLSLKQPDLAALHQAQPSLPKLAGTLQGSIGLQGTYAALAAEVDMQLQQLGMEGSVEKLRGPLHLSGRLATAASVAALAQELQQGKLAPQFQNLVLRIPSLEGQLPSQGAPAQFFQVREVTGQADAQWAPAGLHATLQRLQAQTTGFGLPPTSLLLEARLTPQRLDLTRLQARLPQSEVQVRGHLTLPEQSVQLQCDIPRLRLDELPVSLPPDFPPLLQGGLTVRGSIPSPQVEADLRYAGGRLRAELAAQLQEAVPRYQATLRVDGLDLAQLLPRAQGRLQTEVRLQGSGFAAEQRRATLEMHLTSNGLNLAPGLSARLQASLAGDTLQVPRLQVRSTPVEFVANGTLSASGQSALDYRLTLGDLRPLGQFLGTELQGKGGVTGKVQGKGGVLQTQATLQLDNARVATFQIQRVRANLNVTQLQASPQGTLKAQIDDLQGPSLPPTSLRLEAARTPQQGTFTMAVSKGPYERSSIAGTLFLEAASQRLVVHPLRLHYQNLAWENAAPITLVHHQQGQIQVERLALRSGSQELTVQATLMPNGPVQAEVRLTQLQIRPIVQAFAPDAAVPDGRLQLNAALRGTFQQPQLQGTLQLTGLQWQQRQLGELHATLNQSGESVRTELRWQDQGRQLLHLHGTTGLGMTAPVDVTVQTSAFDLALLALFSPEVTQSAGTLGLDLHLTGTPQQPRVQGLLSLRDGVLQLAATGERYRDIQARLQFAGDHLEIEQLQVGSRSGTLQLSGQVAHAGLTLRQIDLALRAQDFTAMSTPGIEAVLSADIRARGPQDALLVSGKLNVPRARLVTNKLPGGGPKAVEPWELTVPGVYGRRKKDGTTPDGAAAVQVGADGILSALRADIAIDMPQNVWVQGPGTAVEMSGELRVSKERQAPFIISGTVQTIRGFASFYGKKFELTQGQVTFTGAPEINPQLDVTVTRKVSDYVVTIHAGGKAQQPEIMLSSTPPLDQMDIVSLLVVGKTTDKLTSSEQTSFSKQAQQLVGGAVASQLEGVVGETLGLDTIELTTDSAKVGRYVTQDLFLSYERGLADKETGNVVGAEYSINRRVKLKGTSSDKGETALDLLWRLDY